MLLALNKATLVDTSIGPFEHAMALTPILHKGPYVLPPIGPCHLTLTVHFVASPLPSVCLAVCPAIVAFAAQIVIFEIARIAATVDE